MAFDLISNTAFSNFSFDLLTISAFPPLATVDTATAFPIPDDPPTMMVFIGWSIVYAQVRVTDRNDVKMKKACSSLKILDELDIIALILRSLERFGFRCRFNGYCYLY